MKRARINPRSPRKAAQWREYVKARDLFIKNNPMCHVRSPICIVKTSCVHHRRGRGIYLAVVKYFTASCEVCNSWLETSEGKKWGYSNGFRLDRIGIIKD